jgi:cobalamin biosynthesis protein CobD/CbiB
MSGRLSRIIDRGRLLTESKAVSFDPDKLTRELKILERRRHYTSIAITMCTISALSVCLVIVTLFVEVMVFVPLKWIIGGLFTFATLAIVVGLAFFLLEVHTSSRTVRLTMSKKKIKWYSSKDPGGHTAVKSTLSKHRH